MRFNRFLHLIAFSGKAHRGSPASGRLTTKMPEADAPSQVNSRADFGRYIPLSGGVELFIMALETEDAAKEVSAAPASTPYLTSKCILATGIGLSPVLWV